MEISKVSFLEGFFLKRFYKAKEEIYFDFFKYKYAKVKINNNLLMLWQLDRFDLDVSYINKIFFIDTLKKKELNLFKKNNINTIKFVYEAKEDDMVNLTSYGFYKKDANIVMTLKLNNKKVLIDDKNISFRQFVKGKDDKLRCDIQNEVFHEADRIPLTPRDIAYEYNRSLFIENMSKFIMLDGKEIGYGQILILDGTYTIANLGILKKYQGKGYGKKLLSYLLNLAIDNNLSEISIRVKESNKVAHHLYKQFGFKEVSKTDSYEIL